MYLSAGTLYAEGQSACVVVSNSPPSTHTDDQNLGSVNDTEQKQGQLLGATMANSGDRFMVGSYNLHLCNLHLCNLHLCNLSVFKTLVAMYIMCKHQFPYVCAVCVRICFCFRCALLCTPKSEDKHFGTLESVFIQIDL